MVDKNPTQTTPIEIIQQKLVHREEDQQLILALVWRDVSGNLYRIEDNETINKLTHQITKHHIENEPDFEKKKFYQELLGRITKGYELDIDQQQKKSQQTTHRQLNAPEEKPLLQHLMQHAYHAYRNISFTPAQRAEQTVNEYSEELKNDLYSIRQQYPADRSQEELSRTLTNYQNRYEKFLTEWLHSKSRTASPMITGPSNFPADRMRKLYNSMQKKHSHFRKWRENALKALTRELKPKTSELDQARENLNSRLKSQELMKSANIILRKAEPDIDEKLNQLGLDQKTIDTLKNPKPPYSPGYQSFELRNNLAEIRRLQTHVTMLEAKQNLAQTQGKKSEEINGIQIVHNYEADRIQLHFEGKPAPDVIKELKSNGFRWTPQPDGLAAKTHQQCHPCPTNNCKEKLFIKLTFTIKTTYIPHFNTLS